MAVANPVASLSSADTAGAGTAGDCLGAATVVTGAMKQASLVAAVTSWALTDATQPTVLTVGLEVSLDNSVYVRVAQATITGNGTFACASSAPFPFRYVNAVLDAIDANISAVSVDAYAAASA